MSFNARKGILKFQYEVTGIVAKNRPKLHTLKQWRS